MNLDDQYNPAHRQAVNLQGRFHDYVGHAQQHYNPQAALLEHQIHHLVGEIEERKDPHTIEERIKVIQRQLRASQIHETPIMHHDHLNELQGHYEQLRQQIHRFDGDIHH